MVLGRIKLIFVLMTIGALGVRERRGGKLSQNQLAVRRVELGQILRRAG